MKYCVLAFMLLATPAIAQVKVGCSLMDFKGSRIGYQFVLNDDGDLTEISAFKDGSELIHSPKKRPVWVTKPIEDGVHLTYTPEPEYTLVMRDGQNNRLPARLQKEGQVIASGLCIAQVPRPKPDLKLR